MDFTPINRVDWIQTDLEPRSPAQVDLGDTEYGISKAVQRKLAGLRTDLDKLSHPREKMPSGIRIICVHQYLR